MQGGYQIIGVLLSAAIGLFAGGIVGVIFKIINKHNDIQQFNDNEIYVLDKKYEEEGEFDRLKSSAQND